MKGGEESIRVKGVPLRGERKVVVVGGWKSLERRSFVWYSYGLSQIVLVNLLFFPFYNMDFYAHVQKMGEVEVYGEDILYGRGVLESIINQSDTSNLHKGE